MPTPACVAISWSVDATPPRVGSRITWTFSPRPPRRSATRPLRAAVSLASVVSKRRPSRSDMIAIPCTAISPLTRTTSPGRARFGEITMPGATRPTPLTLMKTPSPFPRSTTFVSPVTIGTPAPAAAACIEATMRERSLRGRPSSRMRPAESASGCAPHIARSFTVPCTASEPMSPPGKKSGLTTNESVENARRAPPTSKTAPSCSSRSAGLSKLLRKTFSIRRCVIRPPPPCARRIVSPSPAGTGQLAASSAAPGSPAVSFALMSSSHGPRVEVVGRAGALGRHHGRAEGMLRRAARAERRAAARLFPALQDLARDALLWLVGGDVRDVEPRRGVERRIRRPQPVAAFRDHADAAPGAVAGLEDLGEDGLRRAIPSGRHRARVLVLHAEASFLERRDRHVDALEEVERLEARDDHREAVPRREGSVLGRAHDGADMSREEERLHAIRGRRKNRLDRGRHEDVRREDREVRKAELLRPLHRHGVRGRRGLEADGEEHDLAARVLLGEAHRVERRIDHPHVAALRLDAEEARRRAGHAQHVAERREDHAGAARDREGPVDLGEWRDAHGAARPVHERDLGREHSVDAGPEERVRLPAADLHERPRAGHARADRADESLRVLLAAVLVHEAHQDSRAGCGTSSSESSPSSFSVRKTSRAWSSSSLLMANPTCTSTQSPGTTSGVYAKHTSFVMPPKLTTPIGMSTALGSNLTTFPGTPRHMEHPTIATYTSEAVSRCDADASSIGPRRGPAPGRSPRRSGALRGGGAR